MSGRRCGELVSDYFEYFIVKHSVSFVLNG